MNYQHIKQKHICDSFVNDFVEKKNLLENENNFIENENLLENENNIQKKDAKKHYNNVINKLHDYIFSLKEENMQSLSRPPVFFNKINSIPPENNNDVSIKGQIQTQRKQNERNNSFFYPKQKDSLFWCFFIIKNGFAAYETPNTTSFVNEKKIKFEYIELLRKKKQILKSHEVFKKIKNKDTIEHELANKEKIGEKTFIALCIVENLNVLFIHNKKCFEITCGGFSDDGVLSPAHETEPVYVIHSINNPSMNNPSMNNPSMNNPSTNKKNEIRYCYEINPCKKKIDDYREKYFKWENIDKPLLSMTSYKLDELKEIYKKIFGNEKSQDEKKTKKEYYDYILSNI